MLSLLLLMLVQPGTVKQPDTVVLAGQDEIVKDATSTLR